MHLSLATTTSAGLARILLPAALLIATAVPARADDTTAPTTQTADDAHEQVAATADSPIDALVRAAYAHNLELQAAHARWQASSERPAQARSLPDPVLGYGYFVKRMETRQRFSLQQMFPGGGRRGLEAEAATRAAEAAEAALETTAARVRSEVLQAFADWLLVRQTHALVAQNLDIVVSLQAIVQQRHRSGDASLADLLRLESEADLLRLDLAELEERRAPALARLNARLGRPGDTPPDPALAALTSLPPLPPLPAVDLSPDLAARLAANPELLERRHLVRQAETRRELSRRANRPDFMVGVEFMDNRGMARDEVLGMVSVNLPVWRTRTAALRREATADLRAAELDHADRRLSLEAEARQTLFALAAAARRLRLYDDTLLPRARQTLDLVEADYRTGRATFLDLLEARRALLALEQAALNTRADHFRRHAEWEQLAGPFSSTVTKTDSADE
jgi:outer membrane protein TolC